TFRCLALPSSTVNIVALHLFYLPCRLPLALPHCDPLPKRAPSHNSLDNEPPHHHNGRRPHLRVPRQHELRRLLRRHRPRPQEARRRRELRRLPREPNSQGRHPPALRGRPREDCQDGQDYQLGHGRRRREAGQGARRGVMRRKEQAVFAKEWAWPRGCRGRAL
ncbi:hypothetical protein TPAR_03130, partial [Tolypocladium paradoxum]